MMIILCIVSIVVGLLIGTVGVGGILLIPALNIFAEMPIHSSMGTSLLTFIGTGLLGTYLYQRHGSIDWSITIPICAGSLFFGYVGALANSYAPAGILNLLLGVVIIFAGGYALLPSRRTAIAPRTAHLPLLLAVGAAVGFGSGLTGVGGPVLSVPLMVILGFSPLTSIATSQVIQITAALSGSLGNAAHGSIDYGVALWVGSLELVGVVLGARLAHSISMSTLKKLVSLVCIVVGAAVLLRALSAL